MKYIDQFLNKITMYKLTLYFLIFLIGIAMLLSSFGILHQNAIDILLNSIIAICVSYIANKVLAAFFHASINTESSMITGLILTIIIPTKFPYNASFLIIACVIAMASKYFLTIDKRHIFNPAAAAVSGIELISAQHSPDWWIGSQAMMPFVLIGGLLVVRKIKREALVGTFFVSYLLLIACTGFIHGGSLSTIMRNWQIGFFQSALFFFTFIMLTEPITTPGRKHMQMWYAIFVAILYVTPVIPILGFTFTPEIALCAGNVFSYFISPNYRLVLRLQQKIQVAKDTMLFVFQPSQKFAYLPGQYLEWTLPHKNVDSRGNRRYFSIASSPTESDLMMSVRLYTPSSSYKTALSNMKIGETMIASSLAGDFVLPKDAKKPLVFIAGGIGIIPFRSMIQSLVDKNQSRDIIVLYANRQAEHIAFIDLLAKAATLGIKTHYILTDKALVPPQWGGYAGRITPDMVKILIPDYIKRVFYISGPQLMVEQMEQDLQGLQLPSNQIITDYFPGY